MQDFSSAIHGFWFYVAIGVGFLGNALFRFFFEAIKKSELATTIQDAISHILSRLLIHGKLARKYCENTAISSSNHLVRCRTKSNDVKECGEKSGFVYIEGRAFILREEIFDSTYSERDSSYLIFALIDSVDCAVILGNPGTGKTATLQYIANRLARQYLCAKARHPLPVYLHAERLSGTSTIEQEIERVFDNNGFPRALSFIRSKLDSGLLYLLVDGIDEVPLEKRHLVCKKIDGFLERKDIRPFLLVACRARAFHPAMFDNVPNVFELREFEDRDVEEYLRLVGPCLRKATPESILASIRISPRIVQISRIPLFLKLLVNMHDRGSVGNPHSRADFLLQVVNELLQRRRAVTALQADLFPDSCKRLVLQHIANHLHARSTNGNSESMPEAELRKQIVDALQSVGRSPEYGAEMFAELVDVTQLLIAVDGGAGYAFAHRYIQEFFVACYYSTDIEKLINHYHADPDGYLEVLRLWCGLEHDSSAALRALSESNPMLCLSLLAEIKEADDVEVQNTITLATRNLEAMKFPDASADPSETASFEQQMKTVSGIFADAATATSTWGDQVFSHLLDSLLGYQITTPKFFVAIMALARTYRPQAAIALIGIFHKLDREIEALDKRRREIGWQVTTPKVTWDTTASLAYLIRKGHLPNLDLLSMCNPTVVSALEDRERILLAMQRFEAIKQKIQAELLSMGDSCIEPILDYRRKHGGDDGKFQEFLSLIGTERAAAAIDEIASLGKQKPGDVSR